MSACQDSVVFGPFVNKMMFSFLFVCYVNFVCQYYLLEDIELVKGFYVLYKSC